MSLNGNNIACAESGGCYVWSIPDSEKLYSLTHKSDVTHVRFYSDQDLRFDLITASKDKTVKFWLSGFHVKTLEHWTKICLSFDLSIEKRLLAVATDEVGVPMNLAPAG